MGFFVFVRRRVRRSRTVRSKDTTAHYRAHKEAARAFIHERIEVLNREYDLSYNRIIIRDQHTRWGSCSARRNLNFNYRLLFLPRHLADYVIVHELCHLAEMNHSPRFWEKVEATIPEYRTHRNELKKIPISHATSYAV